jgi:pullulanase/glycogen debranching enzyme
MPADVAWLAADGRPLDGNGWDAPDAYTLGLTLFDAATDDFVWLVLQGGRDEILLTPPPARAGRRWQLAVDTAARAPVGSPVGTTVLAAPRSVLLFVET